MSVSDILNSVKFVIDPDEQQSAVVDMEVWEQIVPLLEDAENAEELEKARELKEETILWKAMK